MHQSLKIRDSSSGEDDKFGKARNLQHQHLEEIQRLGKLRC